MSLRRAPAPSSTRPAPAAGSIATAESCTGGLRRRGAHRHRRRLGRLRPRLRHLLQPGQGRDARRRRRRCSTTHGAVSEPVARAMAQGALAASDADIAVAVTGVAGPGGSEAKPEGLVWFAVATARRRVTPRRREFGAARPRRGARGAASRHALDLLLQAARARAVERLPPAARRPGRCRCIASLEDQRRSAPCRTPSGTRSRRRSRPRSRPARRGSASGCCR